MHEIYVSREENYERSNSFINYYVDLCRCIFVVLVKDVIAHKNELDKSKMGFNVIVSMVANFFDTLGIGSYAIATSAWKFNKSIKMI